MPVRIGTSSRRRRQVAHTDSAPMPPILDAADAYATVDVASGCPRSTPGEYREA